MTPPGVYAVTTADTDRFCEYVEVDEDCWNWSGAHANGYGRFNWAGNSRLAHHFAYVWLVGEIPPGLELDHVCRNRGCVNPSHLEPVTHRENMLRGDTIAARNASRTHCPAGHEYTERNTRLYRGLRYCVECGRERARRYYWDKKGGSSCDK